MQDDRYTSFLYEEYRAFSGRLLVEIVVYRLLLMLLTAIAFLLPVSPPAVLASVPLFVWLFSVFHSQRYRSYVSRLRGIEDEVIQLLGDSAMKGRSIRFEYSMTRREPVIFKLLARYVFPFAVTALVVLRILIRN